MTNEEALKVIYEMICLKLLTPQEDEALHIAYRALEEVLPKKPKVFDNGESLISYICPKCYIISLIQINIFCSNMRRCY